MTGVAGGGVPTVMTQQQAYGALKAAGWPSPMWATMVAIGQAESGLTIDKVSPRNKNGTYDRGWLQINDVHRYDHARLVSDPVYNAKAGLNIYSTQGLNAWSVYKSGKFAQYLPSAVEAGKKPAETPPNLGAQVLGILGNAAGTVAGATGVSEAAGDIATITARAILGPVSGTLDVAGGVGQLGRGLATIASGYVAVWQWIGDPHNWLRVLEVIGGATALLIGLKMLAESGVGGPVGAAAQGASKATDAAGKATMALATHSASAAGAAAAKGASKAAQAGAAAKGAGSGVKAGATSGKIGSAYKSAKAIKGKG